MRRTEWSSIAYLLIITTLAIPYALLPILTGLRWSADFMLILVLAIWLLPLVYIAILWRRWRSLIPFDYLMFAAPLAAWLFASVVLKFAVWEVTNGHGVLGPYGRDKGLSNALAEPVLVLAISGLYLFVVPANPAGSRDPQRSRRVLLASSCIAVGVALIVPPLAD